MSEVKQLALTPTGRILVPPIIRERLGLVPGKRLVVEEESGDLFLRPESEAPLVNKGGVLVVQSRVVGDIENVVRLERDRRTLELVQM